ncbi:esterase family protein [Gordonia sp. X0973]|uniref:alpha/beta hydrolase n=1 Tax=Gordonia sp. X0973 TaxID=2742602 RepID=UPI000F53C7E2|nr:alpha/beta hydrolase family protein [Gordonia sp. X0973]QKT09254.1 esterase family protein [Gordonia sp. X0973]
MVLAALMAAALCAGTAQAAPASRITSSYDDGPQETTLVVYSAAMRQAYPITVLKPRNQNKPAPVLYLLNGAGGGEDSATWAARTTYTKFFKNKNVYVVTPIGGAFSYYTDWMHRDLMLGKPMWQTFLTKELPPLINAKFNTTKRNAVAGISMAGTSVFNLAIAKPGLYRSVAAFSGCARTSDPLGQQYIKMVIDRGQGNIANMWGPLNGPGWRKNDPYIQAPRLRGTKIYMTTGTGLPGAHENLADKGIAGDPGTLANQTIVGGLIEAAVNQCTQDMAVRLSSLGIPFKLTTRPGGTHSWGYWEDDLHNTWPSLARDLRTR